MTKEDQKKIDDANKLIQDERKAALEAFQVAYNKLCDEHGYSFMPVITINGNGKVTGAFEINRTTK
jgi:hypothetical protein